MQAVNCLPQGPWQIHLSDADTENFTIIAQMLDAPLYIAFSGILL